MYVLGCEIGPERREEAEQDLQAGIFACAPAQEILGSHQDEGGQGADTETTKSQPNKSGCSLREGEGPGQSGSNGKAQADEAGGVVQESLALKDMHQAPWNGSLSSDGRNGDGIGRRQDGCKSKGHSERDAGDHAVDQHADPKHRQRDETKRQRHHGFAVPEEVTLRDAPAVEEQERWQENEKEDLGVERCARQWPEGKGHTDRDLDQRKR
ncbi:hypothetical protein AFCDBAGC_5079 [Methylobacterium cerastii]|uniref:Uncharacterized protein n=1 Tax=Methylobacterium cerastii TaxID=932741 RepID=A0ABQ4QPG9_9HYPH|nr:hypothetical protein AFCDBAGC_5079 [Methylobacterium cerastii]